MSGLLYRNKNVVIVIKNYIRSRHQSFSGPAQFCYIFLLCWKYNPWDRFFQILVIKASFTRKIQGNCLDIL